ncbi:MAG TPA: hypothetical protein VK518_17320, partial [Puia sp.]|nr:hypothetical protein [Puia sp.]
SSALSLAPFSRNAGTASALMGGIQMSSGALTSATVGWLSNRTAVPMAAVMAACAVTALTILLTGRKVIRYRAELAVIERESVDDITMS